MALWLFLTAFQPSWALDLYVSPKGNDSWSGHLASPNASSTDGPFRTPQKALQASRLARKADPQAPCRILFKGGTHELEQAIVFYVADSGLALESAPGEAATLSGGRNIIGWKPDGKLWFAPVPEDWNFRMLVVNGEIRPRARLPKTDYLTHETRFTLNWKSTTGGEWGRPLTEEETTKMVYREGDLGDWLNINNAELEVLHMWDESWTGLAALDPKTRTLTFSLRTTHPPGAFGVTQYAVWNVQEGLTDPGQWFLDRTRNRVFYWPKPGETLSRFKAEAPVLFQLFRFEGYKDLPVSQVTLKGLALTLSDTPLKGCGFGSMDTQGAVQMFHAGDCRLEGLKVFNVNGHGLKTHDASGITVVDCEFFNTGSVGAALRGAGNRVENCLFHHVGRTYNSAIALWSEGRDAVLSHNEIRDVPYDGIMNNASNTLIENNFFERCMLVMHDGAAIYTGFCKAVTIRGNVVKDVPDTGGYGSSAYYLDETAEDCLVEDNLTVGVARPAQNHMAVNNTLRGNLFIVDGQGKMTLPRCRGYKLEGNVFYATGSWVFSFAEGGIVSWSDNIIYSGTGTVQWEKLVDYSPNGVSDLAPKDGTILGDPGLKDPLKGDYSPKEGSPAAKLLKMSWRSAGRTTH